MNIKNLFNFVNHKEDMANKKDTYGFVEGGGEHL